MNIHDGIRGWAIAHFGDCSPIITEAPEGLILSITRIEPGMRHQYDLHLKPLHGGQIALQSVTVDANSVH